MFFTKPEYTEIILPIRHVSDPIDAECGGITFEGHGIILGAEKYCVASYRLNDPRMYENGDYEQLIDLLENAGTKPVKLTVKSKKGVPKDFTIDVDSLAEAYGDQRLKALELLCWGLNDKSFQEQTT